MHRRIEQLFPPPLGGRSIGREVLGGATTFAALSYILFVQPAVLSQAGMNFHAVLLATCLSAAFATFLMGWLANYPVALAPGMGENFFFVYTLCAAPPLGFGLSWQQALTATFLAGALFMLLSARGYLGRLVNVVPDSLKTGIAAGIGFFITLIGFEYGNLVQMHPATLLQLGDLRHPATVLALLGLLLTLALLLYHVPGAILLGILGTAGMAWAMGLAHYRGVFSAELDLSETFFQLDFGGLFRLSPATLIAAIFVLFLLDLFDSLGTVVAVGQQAQLMREGRLPRANQALFSSAAGTAVGACLGTSTVVCYVESATGVAEGARTGLANMVTCVLLLAAMFFSPLISLVGGGIEVGRDAFNNPILRYPILAPALIVVGSLMMRIVRQLPWDDATEYIPAFLIVVTIPFAFSISAGIAMGFVSYAFAKTVTRRWKECHWLIYLFAALFALQYALFH
ncbi:MAG: NCS2 family permease [Acidobacteria bacterium]|nr:NCS2 family permease [Acidobacteriota bacterium]